MKISISLGGDRFVSRESMVLTVRVINPGTRPIEVPDPGEGQNQQPLYRIEGPSFPQGHTFQAGRPLKPGQQPLPPILVRIAPGEEHESVIPLEMLVRFPKPGKHTLTARIEWAGAVATSESVSFTVEEPIFKAARIMADDGFQQPSMQRVLALVGQPPRLYQFVFREQRPGIGEIRFAKMIPASVPAASATDVVAPWTNFDRSDVFFFRTGWEDGAQVGMESNEAVERAVAPLDPGERVIHPALMAADGAAHVFVHSSSGIRLVRLPLPDEGKPPGPSETVWSGKLPHPVSASRAALSPAPSSQCFAWTVSQLEKGKVAALLFDPRGANPRSVEIQDAQLLPGMQPALWTDSAGHAHGAFLAARQDSPASISLITIEWPGGALEANVTRKSIAELPAASQASVLSFSVSPQRPPRLDWVVMLEDGSVMSSKSPGRIQRLPEPPVRPLQLLSMSAAMYLLVQDPVDILRFRNLQ